MSKLVVQVACCLFLYAPTAAAAGKRQPIVLSAVDLPNYARLYEETFRILNAHSDKYELTFQYMPNRRQMMAASSGIVDGIGIKTEQSAGQVPGLLKINTPLYFADSLLSILAAGADIQDKQALAKLKVAVLNGSGHSMNVVPEGARVIVNTHLSGLLMVASKRVDAMSILDLGYYTTLQSSPETAAKIKLATYRERVPFYIYLHERKKSQLSGLEDVVKKATANGEIQKSYDRIIEEMKVRFEKSIGR